MKHTLYILFFLMNLLKAEALLENVPITKQSDCWRCSTERCPKNPVLAQSCLEVCRKAATYPKIRNNCYIGGELKGALSKSEGSRLVEVQIPEAKDLDKNDGLKNGSQLTPKGIFMVLQELKLIAPGKNPDEADQALVIKTVEPGYYSTRIYIVDVKETYRNTLESLFVIKGLKNADQVSGAEMNTPQKEMQGLAKVQQFIIPELKGTNVHIAETKGAFWYYDKAELFGAPMDLKKNYIVVLGIASGEAVDSLGKKYLQGEMTDKDWNDLMRNVGEAIGKVHFALATPETKRNLLNGIVNLAEFKTIIHGDLHLGNIFYDTKTQEVTFIDVASMADTLREKVSPLRDISDICLSIKPYIQKSPESPQSFVEGYASAFPEASQADLKTGIDRICQETPL